MIERDRQTGPPNPPGTCRSPSARETFVVAETVRPRNGHRAHRVSQLSDMTRRVVDIVRNGPKRSLRPRPDSADSGSRISRRGKATSELPRTAARVSRKSLLLPKIEGCDSRGWKVERQLQTIIERDGGDKCFGLVWPLNLGTWSLTGLVPIVVDVI